MKSRQLAVPALMTLSLFASACAEGDDAIEDEGEVSLVSPEDQDKDDSIFGKNLRYFVSGRWPWMSDFGTRIKTDTTVHSQTDTAMRVEAYRLHFALPADQVVELSVDAEAFNDLGEISTDMAFLLFDYAGDGEWNVVRCDDRSYFKSVVIDRKHEELDALARTAEGEVEKTYTFAECGISEDAHVIGLFPFPSSNWGNMEGYYHLGVDVLCNGDVCPDSPAGVY